MKATFGATLPRRRYRRQDICIVRDGFVEDNPAAVNLSP